MSYSFSLTTFNPSGKLLQIEYALKAVQKGQTAVGIKAVNGAVLATEKILPSTLMDSKAMQKISFITPSICMTYAGMTPDTRVLVARARKHASKYYSIYHEHIPVKQLVKRVANVMQEFTQSGGVRPFGVALMIAGVDHDGPHLYQVDPSGAYFAWKANAMGKNFINAKEFLKKRCDDTMELEDAVHTALLTLKEGFEGEMNENNIELAKIQIKEDGTQVMQILEPSEIKDYLEEFE